MLISLCDFIVTFVIFFPLILVVSSSVFLFLLLDKINGSENIKNRLFKGFFINLVSLVLLFIVSLLIMILKSCF